MHTRCHRQAADVTTQRHYRAQGEINPTRENYEKDSQCDDCGKSNLPTYQEEISCSYKIWLKNRDQYYQPDQCDKNTCLPSMKQLLEKVSFHDVDGGSTS